MRFNPAVALLASAVVACTPDRPATPPPDADLTATELFTLEELPGAPLGEFSSLLRWRDGWVLADGTNRQIVVFDSVGRRLGSMGRKGGGPGEFTRLGPLALMNDTTVLALDLDLQRLSTWGLPQRVMIGIERRVDVPHFPQTLLIRPDGILIGDIRPADLQSIELLDAATLTPIRGGATAPALYRQSDFVAGSFSSASIEAIGDSLLIGWQLVDSLRMLGPALEPGRMIGVPVQRRRGSPPDLVQRGKNIGDVVGMIPHTSLLSRVGVLSNGRIGLIHVDLLREVGANGLPRGGSREVWLTVLDRAGAPLCVDQRVAARTPDVVRAHFIRGELVTFRTSADDGVTRVSRVELPEECRGV